MASSEALMALQVELKGVKERWGKEVKLKKAEKGSTNFPFPVSVERVICQPESGKGSMIDTDTIKVRLTVESGAIDDTPVRVTVPMEDQLPEALRLKMQDYVTAEWKLRLREKAGASWCIEGVLEHCEEKYAELLWLEPSVIESYLCSDAAGASCRRFAIGNVVVVTEPAAKELTPEEQAAEEEALRIRKEEMAREREEREEREAREAELEKLRLGEERRRQVELGLIAAPPKQLSRKEKEAMEAAKGGRLRKTGARHSKYAGPGSAVEKGTVKGKKDKNK